MIIITINFFITIIIINIFLHSIITWYFFITMWKKWKNVCMILCFVLLYNILLIDRSLIKTKYDVLIKL